MKPLGCIFAILRDESQLEKEFVATFAPISSAEVRLGRNSSGYEIDFQSRPGFPSDFGVAQAQQLLASGSEWSPAFGWASHFGFPFLHKERELLVLGMERYPRIQANNCYLAATCFIFECSKLPQLISRLAAWRKCFFNRLATRRKLERPIFQDISLADSANPAEHAVVEGWVIDQAVNAYKKNRRLYWRTLAFAHGHFVNPSTAKKRLLVTVPALLALVPTRPCRCRPKLETVIAVP